MHIYPHVGMVFSKLNQLKKWLGMYVHYITRYVIIFLHFMSLDKIILELLACGWCWCKSVHSVLMLRVD
jgi:hypothetical protein